MKHSALKELYIDELRDIYNAETQLVKALPKMAKASNSDQLRAGFESHLEQTGDHVERLEEIFKALGENPAGKKCAGMQGLVKEGEQIMSEDFDGEVLDAALISAAQRVEHYEIAAYGCVKTWAGLLGEGDAQALLEKTLEEEKEADSKLTELSKEINVQAKAQGEEEVENEDGAQSRKSQKVRTARA